MYDIMSPIVYNKSSLQDWWQQSNNAKLGCIVLSLPKFPYIISIWAFVTPQLHGFFESSKVMRHKATLTAFGKKVPALPRAFPASQTSHLITFPSLWTKTCFITSFYSLRDLHWWTVNLASAGGEAACTVSYLACCCYCIRPLLLAWAFAKDQQDKNRKERLKIKKIKCLIPPQQQKSRWSTEEDDEGGKSCKFLLENH